MSSLGGPRSRRRIRFMLTPLVDVMFLLLIFFMLSSQTSTYALLDVLSSPDNGVAPQDHASTGDVALSTPEALIIVANGYVRLNGTRFEMFEVSAALATLKENGSTRAVVMTQLETTVQDVVSVFEALEEHSITDLRVVNAVAMQ